MLLNAIATLILLGMMLVPVVNVFVGAIVGGGLAGPEGSLFGIVLALLITTAEVMLADRLGWRDLTCPPEEVPELAAASHYEAVAVSERADPPTIRTGPAAGRRKLGRPGADLGHRPPRRAGVHLSHAR